MDYLDLYLMHFPIAFEFTGLDIPKAIPKDENGNIKLAKVSLRETWQAMEVSSRFYIFLTKKELVDEGLVKAIGISNFNILLTQDLLCSARIKPAVNQVETHPYFIREDLIKFCRQNDIIVQAYSPLGNSTIQRQK